MDATTGHCYKTKDCSDVTVLITELEVQSYVLGNFVPVPSGTTDVVISWLVPLGITTKQMTALMWEWFYSTMNIFC